MKKRKQTMHQFCRRIPPPPLIFAKCYTKILDPPLKKVDHYRFIIIRLITIGLLLCKNVICSTEVLAPEERTIIRKRVVHHHGDDWVCPGCYFSVTEHPPPPRSRLLTWWCLVASLISVIRLWNNKLVKTPIKPQTCSLYWFNVGPV